jgi:S1-C subfamily serine protease
MEPAGIGSGFIFDAKNGYVMTNDHVISGGEEFIVKLGDKRELSAKLVGADPQTDVAVLKVDPDSLSEAALGDSNAVAVGDWVIAVGNPFGFLEQTVTAGIISAKGRKGLHLNNYEDFLQTDAAINKGNSGGPLVDLNGQVIGINTAIFQENQGGGYQGIGFAIPINQARAIAGKLVKSGQVRRGWMGIGLQGVNAEKAKAAGLAEGTGLEVWEVKMKGPAYQAGIWPGDIVVKVGDRDVKVGGEVGNLVADMEPDEHVKVKLLRLTDKQYAEKEVEVTLGLQPKDWQPKKDSK